MGLPSYVINFDEIADLLEMQLEEEVVRKKRSITGTVNTKTISKSIPPISGNYKILEWSENKEISLQSIKINQSGWKSEDSLSLYIGDVLVIDKSHTKEIPELKTMEINNKITNNDSIVLIYHNNSGNFKEISVEIEYLDNLIEMEGL